MESRRRCRRRSTLLHLALTGCARLRATARRSQPTTSTSRSNRPSSSQPDVRLLQLPSPYSAKSRDVVQMSLMRPAAQGDTHDEVHRESVLGSGIRAAGPGATESFVATALRTFDGDGRFTQVLNAHGQITGAQRNLPATGTYEVKADCSGTAMIFFPGAPAPVETTFVIVGRGEEVKEAVMTPQPNVVMAVL